jgi:DNA-binding NarL/FixJ family response regulator
VAVAGKAHLLSIGTRSGPTRGDCGGLAARARGLGPSPERRQLRGRGSDSTVDELLGLVESEGPDAVLIDIRLPPTYSDEGLRAAAALRARFPSTASVVLSHFIEAEYAMCAYSKGASGASATCLNGAHAARRRGNVLIERVSISARTRAHALQKVPGTKVTGESPAPARAFRTCSLTGRLWSLRSDERTLGGRSLGQQLVQRRSDLVAVFR